MVGHGPPALAGPNPKISPYLSPDFATGSSLLPLLLLLLKPRTKNSPMSFMSSCHCHPKLLLSPPTHLPHNARSSMKTNRDLLSPSTGRRPSFPIGRQATVASPPRRELPLGTSATADEYGSALAAAAPAKTGNISVFLQTGAVLLFAYWIANFVVPNFISKYLGFDKINEEENSEDGDRKISSEGGGGEEERDRGNQANSRMTKKRTFDSTRS